MFRIFHGSHYHQNISRAPPVAIPDPTPDHLLCVLTRCHRDLRFLGHSEFISTPNICASWLLHLGNSCTTHPIHAGTRDPATYLPEVTALRRLHARQKEALKAKRGGSLNTPPPTSESVRPEEPSAHLSPVHQRQGRHGTPLTEPGREKRANRAGPADSARTPEVHEAGRPRSALRARRP